MIQAFVGESYDIVIANTKTVLGDMIFHVGDTFDDYMASEYIIVYEVDEEAEDANKVFYALLRKKDMMMVGKGAFSALREYIDRLFKKQDNGHYDVDYIGEANPKLLDTIKKTLNK